MAPYSCLENPMDGGAWWAAVHGVVNSQTRLSDFPFTFHFHALEKEMATHSSVLAQRIPRTGEPGGLLSMDHTESDTTEVTQRQQQYVSLFNYDNNPMKKVLLSACMEQHTASQDT